MFALWDRVTGRNKLKERLAHASGALSDIQVLVTNCVPKNADSKLHEIARAVLCRILCSAHSPLSKPSWYIHDWEREEWEEYLNGGKHACATKNPTFEEAKRLCG